MKLITLLKYSLYLLVMVLFSFFILTIYIYYFSQKPVVEIAYNFIVPVCLFLTSIMYSKKSHEKGIILGMEIWIVYFAVVLLIKMILKTPTEIDLLKNLIFIPIPVLGGIIGANAKK